MSDRPSPSMQSIIHYIYRQISVLDLLEHLLTFKLKLVLIPLSLLVLLCRRSSAGAALAAVMMADPLARLWWVSFLGSLLLFLMVGSVAQKLPDEEVEALKEIAKKLSMESWDFDANPCSSSQWSSASAGGITSNVTCDCSYNQSTVCHVNVIQLKRMNLTGALPKEFANLQFLVDIDLSLNYLSGPIPKEWASLPLSHLSVMGNRISGTIPKEFGRMTKLTSLVVNDNALNGSLPEELGNLVNLTEFIASANNFSGPLPESFSKLKNLALFMIDGSSISGKIPDFIGSWTELTRLDMQGTAMEGPIPSAISLLTKLNQLRISDLKGSSRSAFPPLQSTTSMQRLILRNCKMFGEIPQYIGDSMKNLVDLDVSFNNFAGKVPDSLQELTQINHLYLSNNMLTGTIPPQLLKSTANVDLSNNNFSGPPQASRCQQGNVNLVGSYSSLQDTSVAACFKKNHPCSGKAKYYSLFINCGGPKGIVDGHEYEDDSLNKGSASYVSSERWAYSSTGNYMDGQDSFVTTNTSALNMSNPELYMTARLSPLSLKYYGLCLQNGNYSVQLHFAEIMLTSDQTYGTVGRRIFDVSIQGKKVLEDFNIADKAGGSGRPLIFNFTTNVTAHTLEIEFYWAGKGTTSAPARGVYGPLISAITVKPNFKPHIDRHGLSIAVIVGIVLGACFTVALILLLLWMGGCLCGKDPIEEELKSLELKTGYFSLKQVKVATNNFDPSTKIGEGGFGPVYKGILPDGAVVAIKQLSSLSKQGSREFVNEIGMISAVQHPNLVTLYGCCVEGNQLLVIYEYMENNNLARALFGPEEHRLKLDWATRRKICIGIARGLAHLHDESRLKIVHRDIKATNVLLDKDLNAKISDFGLAKLNEDENTHISTRIAGTIGYMAPEYAMRGYLTDKADVYSFGVVLLEIVSGKSNMNEQPGDDLLNLLEMAYVLHEKGELLDLVDPNLGSKYSKEEAQRMLNLVLLCTNRSPTIRPKMSEVVCMLEGKMPVKVPHARVGLRSENWRFTAFSKDSQSSQSYSISREGPWFDSSVALSSRDESSSRPSNSKIHEYELIDVRGD